MSFTVTTRGNCPGFLSSRHRRECYSLADFADARVLVVFFTCNHCPFVTGSNAVTRQTAEKYQAQGVTFVGINANTVLVHPEDSFKLMIARMQEEHFPWTYLRDESQTIALAYGALRTPHFFVFDAQRKLSIPGAASTTPSIPPK